MFIWQNWHTNQLYRTGMLFTYVMISPDDNADEILFLFLWFVFKREKTRATFTLPFNEHTIFILLNWVCTLYTYLCKLNKLVDNYHSLDGIPSSVPFFRTCAFVQSIWIQFVFICFFLCARNEISLSLEFNYSQCDTMMIGRGRTQTQTNKQINKSEP